MESLYNLIVAVRKTEILCKDDNDMSRSVNYDTQSNIRGGGILLGVLAERIITTGGLVHMRLYNCKCNYFKM